MPKLVGELPAGSTCSSIRLNVGETHYRLGPLPPGSYTIEGYLTTGKGSAGHPFRTWHGQARFIRVEAGKEAKSVILSLLEVPQSPQK